MCGSPIGGYVFHDCVTLSYPREFSFLPSQYIQQIFFIETNLSVHKHFEWIPNHVHNQTLVHYANC